MSIFPRAGPGVSAAAAVPDDFVARLPAGANVIYVLEIAAALLAISILRKKFPLLGGEMNIILFVDNNASLAALTRASPSCDSAANAIFKFWKCADSDSICPWLERVSTNANPADRPSRFPAEFELVDFPVF